MHYGCVRLRAAFKIACYRACVCVTCRDFRGVGRVNHEVKLPTLNID